MTTIEQLIGEFIDAWNAGRRPDVLAYLARAAPADRDELARQLETWLELAPTPAYDETTRAQIAAEPALLAAFAAAEALRTPLAARLPPLRERAGLAVPDVAQRLTRLVGIDDERRTEEYLERLENDAFDERRLSRRLIVALATILGVNVEQLVPAPVPIGQTFFRAEADPEQWVAESLELLSELALEAAPDQPMDELDRLFLGGPDA